MTTYTTYNWSHKQAAANPLATQAQKDYLLNVLLKDKVMPSVERVKTIALVPSMTKAEASAKITALKALPWKSKSSVSPVAAVEAKIAAGAVEPYKAPEVPQVFDGQGFYRGQSGKVYAYLYNPKKGWPVWKLLVEKSVPVWNDEKGGYDFVKKGSYVKSNSYTAKKDINTLTGKKLTIQEAKNHGHLLGYCLCCGKTLTDPVSVEQKIGPVCLKSYGAMLGLL